MVCGEVRIEDGTPRIIASEIYPLNDCPTLYVEFVRVHFPTGRLAEAPDLMARVRDVLSAHPGRTKVLICLEFASGEKVYLDTDHTYKVTCEESLISELDHILGEGSVYVSVNTEPCRKPKKTFQYRNRETGAGGG